MTDNKETKFVPLDLKKVTEEGEFEGYASKFNETDQGSDSVAKGAFKNSLSSRGVKGIKMLWQHDPSFPIGVWEEIEEDSKGLRVKGRLINAVSKAQEVHSLMMAGVLDGLSIGYRTLKALRDETTGIRILKEVDLWEISVVTFPMLTSAKITSVKTEWSKRDAERVLREAGMPNAMATKLVSAGWPAADTSLARGDPDKELGSVSDQLRQMTENLKRRLT